MIAPMISMRECIKMKRYNVVIVGAGPAIFTALELVKHQRDLVLIIDKGLTITKRVCPARTTENAPIAALCNC